MKKLLMVLVVVSLVLAMPAVKTVSTVSKATASTLKPGTAVKTPLNPKTIDICSVRRPFLLENCESFEMYNITVTFHNATIYNDSSKWASFSISDPEGYVYFMLREGQNYYFLPKTGKLLKLKLHQVINPNQVQVSYVWCPAMIYPRTVTVAAEDQVGTTHGGYGASVYLGQILPSLIPVYEYDYMYNWVGSDNVFEGSYTDFVANGYTYRFTYLNRVSPNTAKVQFVEYN